MSKTQFLILVLLIFIIIVIIIFLLLLIIIIIISIIMTIIRPGWPRVNKERGDLKKISRTQ